MNPNTEVPFARPMLGREEEEAALRVIRSGWLTTGAECLAFEKEFATFLEELGPGSSGSGLHCVALNSATAGLHLALEVLGIRAGDAILTSPYTFVASAEVARYLGAEVCYADIEEGSFHLDPQALLRALDADKEGRIKAVIVIHVSGCSHRLEELAQICRDRGVYLVEDAAHSFPSACKAGPHGTIGDIGVFSFYANKTITTGEGGMFVTRNQAWAERARRKRLHGIDREVWNRYREIGRSWTYDVTELGYKYNLPDLAAAIGRVQLGRAMEFLSARSGIAQAYNEAFGNREWLQIPMTGDPGPEVPGSDLKLGQAWHLYILRLRLERLRISRDEFAARLNERGIACSVHFLPLHLMSYYRGLKVQEFPVSEATSERALSIPIFPGMSPAQKSRVIEEVLQIGDTSSR